MVCGPRVEYSILFCDAAQDSGLFDAAAVDDHNHSRSGGREFGTPVRMTRATLDAVGASASFVQPHGNLRVVQLCGGVEVAYCTKVLADAGADVAVVEPVGGHELRRYGAAELSTAPLYSFLHGGKRSLLDSEVPLSQLLAATDIIVTDALPMAWEELHAEFPHLTVVAITPFGLTGPHSGRVATDLTLQAAGGGMAPRGDVDGAPLMVGGEPSLWFAGALAAASVLGVLPRVQRSGIGELLDVSMLEATHLEHGMYPITFFSMAERPFQSSRGVPVPGIEPTADGFVGFFVITGQQWLDFTALIEQPDWADDDELFVATQRRLRAGELLPAIREWTTARTTEEIVEIAALLRIPVAPIGTGETLAHNDQFVAEEWFVEHPDGFLQPRRPYRFDGEPIPPVLPVPDLGGSDVDDWLPRPAPSAGNGDARLPLDGIRVADFTGFWAGPIVGSFLGGLGADVVHVEGPRRPDGIRMNSIRPMSEPGWWEWSPLFCGANTNKRGLTLDLSSPNGRDAALRLISSADIMIENFSPRVVDQLGLGPEVVRAANPDLVLVRMPAFGLTGPWRDRVGFAQTIEQAVGLAFLTGYEDDVPVIPNGMCDPLAGVYAMIATLVGLAERARTGRGQYVESPMVGAGLHVAAEQLIDYTATGQLRTSMGNRSPLRQQDVYRCAGDDEWIAISIPDDRAMDRLATITGSADPTDLTDWCARRTADEIVEALWPERIAAARVAWAHELLEHPQLVDRGFFEQLVHPVSGEHPYVSWPARFSAGPARWNRMSAPTLGQHNVEVLTELGYTSEEIGELQAQEIISQSVLTTQKRW